MYINRLQQRRRCLPLNGAFCSGLTRFFWVVLYPDGTLPCHVLPSVCLPHPAGGWFVSGEPVFSKARLASPRLRCIELKYDIQQLTGSPSNRDPLLSLSSLIRAGSAGHDMKTSQETVAYQGRPQEDKTLSAERWKPSKRRTTGSQRGQKLVGSGAAVCSSNNVFHDLQLLIKIVGVRNPITGAGRVAMHGCRMEQRTR